MGINQKNLRSKLLIYSYIRLKRTKNTKNKVYLYLILVKGLIDRIKVQKLQKNINYTQLWYSELFIIKCISTYLFGKELLRGPHRMNELNTISDEEIMKYYKNLQNY